MRNPDAAAVHRIAGLFANTEERREQAIGHYHRAAELDPANADNLAPDEPGLHVDLASANKNQGRFADAEKELRLAIGLEKTAISLHALGHVVMYQGREREAIPFFRQALEITPARYLSWMYLGICYRRTNRLADAGPRFDEVPKRPKMRSAASRAVGTFVLSSPISALRLATNGAQISRS